MKLSLALRLGRISNLPTVWTNVLVGALLAGGALGDARLPLLMLAWHLTRAIPTRGPVSRRAS